MWRPWRPSTKASRKTCISNLLGCNAVDCRMVFRVLGVRRACQLAVFRLESHQVVFMPPTKQCQFGSHAVTRLATERRLYHAQRYNHLILHLCTKSVVPSSRLKRFVVHFGNAERMWLQAWCDAEAIQFRDTNVRGNTKIIRWAGSHRSVAYNRRHAILTKSVLNEKTGSVELLAAPRS